jgi:hypothetical protein
MATCRICKQQEATLTATVEGKGNINLCKDCHRAVPPAKRTTHIAWPSAQPYDGPIHERFKQEMHKMVRSLRKDYEL